MSFFKIKNDHSLFMKSKEKEMKLVGKEAGFGDRLRELRKRKGMTSIELGKAVNLSYVTILKYEKNQMRPTWETVDKLAKILDTTNDYLQKGVVPKNSVNDKFEQAYDMCRILLTESVDLDDLSKEMLDFAVKRVKSKAHS